MIAAAVTAVAVVVLLGEVPVVAAAVAVVVGVAVVAAAHARVAVVVVVHNWNKYRCTYTNDFQCTKLQYVRNAFSAFLAHYS